MALNLGKMIPVIHLCIRMNSLILLQLFKFVNMMIVCEVRQSTS